MHADSFMPHGHCYLWQPGLVAIHVLSDFLIGTAYLVISLTLYALMKKIKIPFSAVVLCFGIFIGACGLTHFMEIWTLWYADYWLSGGVKVVTAFASVGTGLYLFKLRHKIVDFAEMAKLSDQRRIDLELLTKTLETRVAERTSELEHALKLRDEFLSIASHELRTPVTALKMQLQLVRRRIDKKDETLSSPEGVVGVTEVCERQVDQLTHLIEDMLDVSRISTGRLSVELKPVDFSLVVEHAVRAFERQFEFAGAKLISSIAPGLVVDGDRNRLDQVVNNLLSNALKYGNSKPVTLSLAKEDGHAVLRVKDEGMGISAEDRERIFRPFERAVSFMNVSGLGLGLHICKQIVEAHGGRIDLQSEPNVGTTFEVGLKISSAAL
jgi:signal transduction histidine kinase